MSQHFCVSIRFLDSFYHGLRTRNEAEWPPSPLRLFQALVSAATNKERFNDHLPSAYSEALQWLERQAEPLLCVPYGVSVAGYCLSVPNNAMDVVAKAWSRGNESNSGDANPAKHRTMKTVRPIYMLDGDAVHYLWRLGDAPDKTTLGHTNALAEIASNIVALGWGIDMAIGHGTVLSQRETDALPGERWVPAGGESSENGLRVPIPGTLDDLSYRHQKFLTRLDHGIFTAPPPLMAFHKIDYRRATDPKPRPFAAFSLLNPDYSGFRPFDTIRKGLTVAGMMRYAAKSAAVDAGWSDQKIDCFIMGHGESCEEADHISVGNNRFAYLPLPSIEQRGSGKVHVGSIRRIICCALADHYQSEISWAEKRLSGKELVEANDQQNAVALLTSIPHQDAVVRKFTDPSSMWTSVTPVILPGYDDPKKNRRRLKNCTDAEEKKRLLIRIDKRIDELLRKAIVQAGYPQVLVDHAELEWRKSGFLSGVDLAHYYGVPDHLARFPRLHVLIRWRDEKGGAIKMPGPVCLGGGRFYGIGLFTAFRESQVCGLA
ncbi:MAG: type I-G CRISPR-associated protein Csb2 [Gammaproteobacteria bacterium]